MIAYLGKEFTSMRNRRQHRKVWLSAILGFVALPMVGIAAPQGQGSQSPDQATIERGRAVFQKYGCYVCHGIGGAGGIKNKNSTKGEYVSSLTGVGGSFSVDDLNERTLKGVASARKKNPQGPTPPVSMALLSRPSSGAGSRATAARTPQRSST